jgi:membrane protein DedA with SNARE-associated domain
VSILESLEEHGYATVALLMMICPPLPSELVLPLTGYQVSRDKLFFPAAIAAATAGAMVHALAVYGLARLGRGPFGRQRDRRPRVARAERWFAKHGERTVFLGRMLSGVRWLVGIPAGLREMPLRRYLPLTAAGITVWNTALIGAGWAAGSADPKVGPVAEKASLAAVALLLLFFGGRWLLLRGGRASATQTPVSAVAARPRAAGPPGARRRSRRS